MTTNIKLFENWLAEEDAVETPPAAATTLTTTVKPGTPATAAPAKVVEYKSFDIIGPGITATVVVSSPKIPFDITNSTLLLNVTGANGNLIFKYNQGTKTLMLDSASKYNYEGVKATITKCNTSEVAKRSLTAIVNDALNQTKTQPPNGDWGTIVSDNLRELIRLAGVTAYRKRVSASILPPVTDYLTNFTVGCQVNIDKPNALTGNYKYSVTGPEPGKSYKTLTIDGTVTPTANPVESIYKSIIKRFSFGNEKARSALLTMLKTIIPLAQADAQKPIA